MQTDSVWVSIAVEESRELLARLKREQWIETMGCAVILGIMRYFRMGDGIMIIIAFLAGVSIVCSQIQIVGARLDAGRSWVERALKEIPDPPRPHECRFPKQDHY